MKRNVNQKGQFLDVSSEYKKEWIKLAPVEELLFSYIRMLESNKSKGF